MADSSNSFGKSAVRLGAKAAIGGAQVSLLLALSGCGLVQLHGQVNGKPFGWGGGAPRRATPAPLVVAQPAPPVVVVAPRVSREQAVVSSAQSDNDAAAVALIALAAMALAAQAASNSGGGDGGSYTPSTAPTTHGFDQEESAYDKAVRRNNCIDSCAYKSSGCQYGEESMACSIRQNNEVSSCRSGCGY